MMVKVGRRPETLPWDYAASPACPPPPSHPHTHSCKTHTRAPKNHTSLSLSACSPTSSQHAAPAAPRANSSSPLTPPCVGPPAWWSASATAAARAREAERCLPLIVPPVLLVADPVAAFSANALPAAQVADAAVSGRHDEEGCAAPRGVGAWAAARAQRERRDERGRGEGARARQRTPPKACRRGRGARRAKPHTETAATTAAAEAHAPSTQAHTRTRVSTRARATPQAAEAEEEGGGGRGRDSRRRPRHAARACTAADAEGGAAARTTIGYATPPPRSPCDPSHARCRAFRPRPPLPSAPTPAVCGVARARVLTRVRVSACLLGACASAAAVVLCAVARPRRQNLSVRCLAPPPLYSLVASLTLCTRPHAPRGGASLLVASPADGRPCHSCRRQVKCSKCHNLIGNDEYVRILRKGFLP